VTIAVTVTAKGVLAERLPAAGRLPDGATVRMLLAAVGLPAGPCVPVVNGVAARATTGLRDGDRVQVYPPSAGG
jgi:sulfur carrier protein ThiS